MNRDDIIRKVREAGLTLRGHYDEPGSTPQELERFAALVTAAEREACAKVCEAQLDDPASREWNAAVKCCVEAVRIKDRV